MRSLSNRHGVPGVPGEEICVETLETFFLSHKCHIFHDDKDCFDFEWRMFRLVPE